MESVNQINTILKNITLIEIDSKPLYRRKRTMVLTGATQNVVENMAMDLSKGNLPNSDIIYSSHLMKHANDMIQYSLAPTEEVMVPNGWSQTRFVVFAHFQQIIGRSVINVYLSGYTDYADVSMVNQYVDPNINIFIHNYVKTTLDRKSGKETLLGVYDIVFDPISDNKNIYYHTMRTVDIQRGVSAANLANTQVVNTLIDNVELANVNDYNPYNVVSEVINSAYKSSLQNDHYELNSFDNINKSVEYTYIPGVHSLDVFRDLFRGKFNYTNRSVSYGDIVKMFPNADSVTDVFMYTARQGYTRLNNYDAVGNATHEAVIVNKIIDTVRPYTLKYLITNLKFTVSYQASGLTHFTLLDKVISIVKLSDVSLFDMFLKEIKDVYAPFWGGLNDLDVMVEISYGTAFISLSLNGNQMHHYAVSLYAYTLASNFVGYKSEFEEKVDELDTLLSTVEASINSDSMSTTEVMPLTIENAHITNNETFNSMGIPIIDDTNKVDVDVIDEFEKGLNELFESRKNIK